ncbi:hypothetical protein BAX97_05030 [Elizabethkingia meningoseptica]|uniref:bacteriocin-like protein n=1 Tax=Elizabethkingia meningoseptica TaxID=238 RepID=UPI0009371BD6|nr:hypothetical protein [Elizabethkingia meningoseptica]OPC33663.1 hypothetical protein BAX97_05030 [Elizabethkingia meningoseptica]
MKNLKKISREELKSINGNGVVAVVGNTLACLGHKEGDKCRLPNGGFGGPPIIGTCKREGIVLTCIKN